MNERPDACPTCGVNADGYTDLLKANTQKLTEQRARIRELENAIADLENAIADMECSCLPHAEPHDGMCQRCMALRATT